MLDEKLELVNNNKRKSDNVQMLETKRNKGNDDSYVQSIDYLKEPSATLIPTAMVRIESRQMISDPVGSMLDSGANPNLISFDLARRLKLPLSAISNKLVGINGVPFVIKYRTIVKVRPWYESNLYIEDAFWILPKESEWMPILPAKMLSVDTSAYLSSRQYADPEYWNPKLISVLLGVNFFAKAIVSVSARTLNGTVLLETLLGIVAFGPHEDEFDESTGQVLASIEYSEEDQLEHLLDRLWSMDQIGSTSTRTPEQELVETHFMQTFKRDTDGAFIVQMPLKENTKDIGSSRQIALRRFMCLERKLERNKDMRVKYIEKMRESIHMGHMKLANVSPRPGELVYYIPHHCITKKFRIVFDASCKSDKGISLNDVQMLGEKLQRDLHEIIMRFRRHKIAVCADIKKMFNQVKLDRQHWNLQRIFWRESKDEPLREYWITVITFGVASSPHIVVRSLVQATEETKRDFPEASRAIKNDYYMDDCTSGAKSVVQAVSLAKEMFQITKG